MIILCNDSILSRLQGLGDILQFASVSDLVNVRQHINGLKLDTDDIINYCIVQPRCCIMGGLNRPETTHLYNWPILNDLMNIYFHENSFLIIRIKT